MKIKEYISTPNDTLRLRVMKAKAKSPKFFKKLYFETYPEENNYEGVNKLNNVLGLKSLDENSIAKIEQVLETLKNS